MKDYYNRFVELSLQQCKSDDYACKIKVKTHNIASKQLRQLQAEMSQTVSENELYMLLNHEDDRVKINAASFCLETKTLVAQAILVLKNMIKISNDSTICFSAKILLEQGNGLREPF